MILATHSTDDAALIPAPAAIPKGLLLNATASVGSSRTSSEPTKRRALEQSCAVLLVPALNLGNSAGRHKDAAMCDAHHVDAELVDHSKAPAKACRVLLWDALKNAHPSQRHAEESCRSGKCERQHRFHRPGPTPCQPEQSLMQISQALKLHLLELRLAVAEDRSQLSVDLPVAFLSPGSCFGTHSKEISTGLYHIVLRVWQREGASCDRGFQVWTFGGLATSTANFRRCQCERHSLLLARLAKDHALQQPEMRLWSCRAVGKASATLPQDITGLVLQIEFAGDAVSFLQQQREE